MCTSSRSWPRCCRLRAGRPSSRGSRRRRRRSAASSRDSAVRRGWRSAMRPGPAATRCGGCWPGSGWRVTSSRRRWSRSAPATASRPIAATPRSSSTLHRGGLLRFVQPPTPETEGLRDLLRCRDDLRCARTAARHRVAKQLLRHGRVFREGKKAWTQLHRAWVARQRLDDPLAQLALEQMLVHLDGIDRQLAALDARLEQIAQRRALGLAGRAAARASAASRP